MPLPITIDADLAAELHESLKELVDFLTSYANRDDIGSATGLRPALTAVLRAVRELDVAILPRQADLPSDDQLGWVIPEDPSEGCTVPLALELEQATTLASTALERSEALNRLLGQIQLGLPSRKAPPELVRRFGFVMGYLFTEIAMPLYRQHPEIEPAWLRE
jgi:hypothetical protein